MFNNIPNADSILFHDTVVCLTIVDGEVYLHNEEDPRYRGAAIPSKAFRYLQNMTDGGQAPNSNSAGTNVYPT